MSTLFLLLPTIRIAVSADYSVQRRLRGERAETFATLLRDRDFRAAAELLDDTLRDELGADGLKSFVVEAESICGRLADRGSFDREQIDEMFMYCRRTRWEQTERIYFWISYDASNRIDGFWPRCGLV